MVLSKISLGKYFSATILFFILLNISTAIPLDTFQPSSSSSKELKIIAAKNALDIGLFPLSKQLYKEALKQENDPTVRQNISLQLASIFINEAKYTQAAEILGQIPPPLPSEAQLLLAIASISTNSTLAKKLTEQIDPKDLPSAYKAWLFIAKGLLAQINQNLKEAKNFFLEARTLATSESLKLHIDMLLFRLELSQGKPPESVEKNLRKKIEKSKNTPHAITLKEYAIVLDELGKKTEAVDILESSIDSLSFKEKNELDSILLLIALISDPESEKGRQYLEKIIERKQNLELSKIAISALTETTNTSNAQSYFSFLTKLIDKQTHPLIDTLLIHRAQLALFLAQNDLAQNDATRLLDEYPGSVHNPKASRILAYTAWASTPPHYRTAANILTKLVETTEDNNERAELNTLIADSYFLNHDYTNAARLYTTLLQDHTHKLPKGPLLYQLILSTIKQNNLNLAEHVLDQFGQDPSIDPLSLWRAEWNLINSMKINGQISTAFTRIQKLLASPSPLPISDDLKLRILWLKAELSLEFGKPEETPSIVDTLLDLIQLSNIDSELKSLLESHALLLKAQALLELKKEEDSLKIIAKLRAKFPNSKSAILSYITEAHYYSSINNPTKAQQQLISLSDNYPESKYAALALYEAALNAESRGLKNTYQEALAILERINSTYPNSPLAYHARFKQGDILRKLGDFSNAQLLYENLIKKYPDHSEKFRAQLALTDCLLAQAINDDSSLLEIAKEYTHLFELPQLSANLRAEAGFKAGLSLVKASQTERAQESFWLTINALLIDRKFNEQLSDQGRYWIARSIFELGDLLEKNATIRQANEVYQLISIYKLPGSTLANSKIK